jgi:PleD family two-component response regulator/glyoxylase-like metal-dependent hydrolase (beta-lactamase superfamily II)
MQDIPQERLMATAYGVDSLGAGYYRIGSRELVAGIQQNSYLLVDAGEAILFDPIAVPDTELFIAAMASVVPREAIRHVVVHRDDPDISLSIQNMEQLGMRFSIVTEWRSWTRMRFFDLGSTPYLVEEHGLSLALSSGRSFKFVHAPHRKFPGALATYDRKAGILLSGDFFAAESDSWSLHADAAYMSRMHEYQKRNLGSGESIRSLATTLSSLDLIAIYPFQGAVILEEIPKCLEMLGSSTGEDGDIVSAADIADELTIKPLSSYGIILDRTVRTSEYLDHEVSKLRAMNERLLEDSDRTAAMKQQDAVTGLFNESAFRSFIDEQASLMLGMEGVEDDTLAIIGIDEGMARIEYQYGPREVEAILKGVSRFIQEAGGVKYPAFRLYGATFALWIPRLAFHEANDLCEKLRRSVETSRAFIEPVTISIGLAALAEIKPGLQDSVEAGSALSETGVRRLRLARKRGGNTICSSSEVGKEVEAKARILVVDDDVVNAGVIRTFLENMDYHVQTAVDGDEALSLVAEEGFDLIISELMVPKIDGFMLKETLSRKSGTKDIPFIMLSYRKDENAVTRAYGHDVDHYLQKPYLLAELLGIVQKLTKAGAGK